MVRAVTAGLSGPGSSPGVLDQDTLLPQCLSPPRRIDRNRLA